MSEKSDKLRAVSYTHLDVYKRQVQESLCCAEHKAVKGRAFCGVHWQASLSIFVRTIKLILVSVSYTHLDVYKRQPYEP